MTVFIIVGLNCNVARYRIVRPVRTSSVIFCTVQCKS